MAPLVLKQLVIMLCIVSVSFFFARRIKPGKTEQQFLSKILLYLVAPCLLLHILDAPYDGEKIKQFIVIALVSAAMHVLSAFVARIFTRSKTAQGKALDGIDRIAVVFTNCGYIGIPLVHGVFGDEGVFYLTGFIAVFNIAMWSYGSFEMSGKIELKKVLLNPSVIAVTAGFILFCLPFRLPQVIAHPAALIASMNTPLSMVILGILFADFRIPSESALYIVHAVKVVLLRLVVSSFVMLAFMFIVLRLTAAVPDAKKIAFVLYIASLCPSGMVTTMFAAVFEKDTSYASLVVSLTSALSLVTVPLFVRLAEAVLR